MLRVPPFTLKGDDGPLSTKDFVPRREGLAETSGNRLTDRRVSSADSTARGDEIAQ